MANSESGPQPFRARLDERRDALRPAELRVARHIADAPHEALVASAAELAARAGASDATVVRMARALGFSGLADLRRRLARELQGDDSPASRVTRTLAEVDAGDELGATLARHAANLDAIAARVTEEAFARAADSLAAARRVIVFGVGPSGALADYLALQLRRFGLDAEALTQTGALLADGLLRLRSGDVVMAMGYDRVSPELRALFGEAAALGLERLLVTDSLGTELEAELGTEPGAGATQVLDVARGRAGGFSQHAGTLAFLEALLVGVAARRPADAVASLRRLSRLRAAAGD